MQRSTSEGKPKAERICAGAIVRHILDRLQRQSDIYESSRCDKDMTTYIRLVALVRESGLTFCFLPTKVQGEKRHSLQIPPSAICYPEKVPLLTDTFKVAKCAESAYRCQVLSGLLLAAIHITQNVLDIKDGLYVFHKTLILQSWKHNIQRRSSPKLRSATKHHLYVKGKNTLYLRFGTLYLKVWNGVGFCLGCRFASLYLGY